MPTENGYPKSFATNWKVSILRAQSLLLLLVINCASIHYCCNRQSTLPFHGGWPRLSTGRFLGFVVGGWWWWWWRVHAMCDGWRRFVCGVGIFLESLSSVRCMGRGQERTGLFSPSFSMRCNACIDMMYCMQEVKKQPTYVSWCSIEMRQIERWCNKINM